VRETETFVYLRMVKQSTPWETPRVTRVGSRAAGPRRVHRVSRATDVAPGTARLCTGCTRSSSIRRFVRRVYRLPVRPTSTVARSPGAHRVGAHRVHATRVHATPAACDDVGPPHRTNPAITRGSDLEDRQRQRLRQPAGGRMALPMSNRGGSDVRHRSRIPARSAQRQRGWNRQPVGIAARSASRRPGSAVSPAGRSRGGSGLGMTIPGPAVYGLPGRRITSRRRRSRGPAKYITAIRSAMTRRTGRGY